MAIYRVTAADIGDSELALKLRMMQGPEMTSALERLDSRHGQDVGSVAEPKKMLDKEIGG